MSINVGMEGGPSATIVPPGLPAELFGYGYQPTAWQTACSTGIAVAGVGATAMGALEMTKAGVAHPIVVTDLTGTLQTPRVVRVR